MTMRCSGKEVFKYEADEMWCSFGVRQDLLLRCWHACDVYWKWKGKEEDLNYILMNLVDDS
jgi:hypothetical protein